MIHVEILVYFQSNRTFKHLPVIEKEKDILVKIKRVHIRKGIK